MENKKLSQKLRILRYLRDFGTITPMDALREFGIMRLAARIYELRKEGFSIQTKRATTLNRYGEEVGYAIYSLS